MSKVSYQTNIEDAAYVELMRMYFKYGDEQLLVLTRVFALPDYFVGEYRKHLVAIEDFRTNAGYVDGVALPESKMEWFATEIEPGILEALRSKLIRKAS